MSRYGLMIDYDFCTGCHTCEVACQQEHDYPAGKCGIKLTKFEYETFEKLCIDYLPFPNDLCDLCKDRVAAGELPSCVKHCQAAVMKYGPVDELVKDLEERHKRVLFVPK
ncbi:MAG: 4Fe-4S binding protein [Desulfuromonadales bacterium]|nr:4Fe-4S binding protein [Desulfuromonadales bacterium]